MPDGGIDFSLNDSDEGIDKTKTVLEESSDDGDDGDRANPMVASFVVE